MFNTEIVSSTTELNVERLKSAGLEGRLRSLQTALEDERKENKRIVEERDELKKQLDAKNEELNHDYSTLLKDLANNVQTIAGWYLIYDKLVSVLFFFFI